MAHVNYIVFVIPNAEPSPHDEINNNKVMHSYLLVCHTYVSIRDKQVIGRVIYDIFLPCDDVLCRPQQRRHGQAYPWNCIHILRQYSLLAPVAKR